MAPTLLETWNPHQLGYNSVIMSDARGAGAGARAARGQSGLWGQRSESPTLYPKVVLNTGPKSGAAFSFWK